MCPLILFWLVNLLTIFSNSLISDAQAYLKYVSLVSLTLQNTFLILVMRYVRTRGGDMFMSTTAVIMSEFFKCVTCLGIIFYQEGNFKGFVNHLYSNIIQQPVDCAKVSVPSFIYVLQNNLLYFAVSNLDAATFQVSINLEKVHQVINVP